MSRTVIAAAVASLVLAGCTGSTEPAQPPTSEDALTTTSPATEEVAVTSEAAPTTEEPEEVEASFPQTEEGAEDFVEHYVATLNGVHLGKQEAQSLRSLSEETCETCRAFADVAETSPFGRPYMQFVSARPVLVGDEAITETVLLQESDGATIDSVFTLTWGGDKWLVSKIQAAGR